jgi:hypothetical protein
MWAFSISERPSPVPRATPMTLGRPHADSTVSTSSPAPLNQSATNSAISRSPAPPGTRSGFTEFMDTNRCASSVSSFISPLTCTALSGLQY